MSSDDRDIFDASNIFAARDIAAGRDILQDALQDPSASVAAQLPVPLMLRDLAAHMRRVAEHMQESPDRWIAHHGDELAAAAGVAITWARGIERKSHHLPEDAQR